MLKMARGGSIHLLTSEAQPGSTIRQRDASGRRPAETRGRVRDCAFLMAVVLVSALPYQFGLGYYCDDWNTRAVLARAESQGWAAMFHQLLTSDPDMLVRPGQYIYLVSGFKLFGQNPFPYHAINTLEVGIAAVLLYMALRALWMKRGVALAVATLWTLLPQCSTDRLWISSQQVSLCMAFAFAGIIALAKWNAMAEQRGGWRWFAGAVVAMALSLLCYEISLGIIVAALGTIGWLRFRNARQEGRSAWKELAPVGLGLAVLFAVGMAKARAQTRMVYHHHFMRLLSHVGRMTQHSLEQAVNFNLWAYGGRMPHVLRALYSEHAIERAGVAVSVVVGLMVGIYFAVELRDEKLPGARRGLLLIGAGFALFWLGAGLFLNRVDIEFAITGTDNRVSMAAAIGAACVVVGLLFAVIAPIKGSFARTRIFAGLMGLVCGINCLVVSGIAHYWVAAAARQQAVLSAVKANVPQLPRGSVLLLDGFCRYTGPGAIFETDWDMTGALTLLTGDATLRGDVMSIDLAAGEDAVRATVPDEDERTYLYGKNLYVYNVQTKRLAELKDRASAEEYFRPENRAGMESCPVGHEGRGAPIF